VPPGISGHALDEDQDRTELHSASQQRELLSRIRRFDAIPEFNHVRPGSFGAASWKKDG
jgi:hypothetical protein